MRVVTYFINVFKQKKKRFANEISIKCHKRKPKMFVVTLHQNVPWELGPSATGETVVTATVPINFECFCFCLSRGAGIILLILNFVASRHVFYFFVTRKSSFKRDVRLILRGALFVLNFAIECKVKRWAAWKWIPINQLVCTILYQKIFKSN